MAKRLFVTLGITALLVAALGFVKFRQIQTAIAQSASFQPPPDAVTTIVAHEESWPASLNAIGTVAAVQGVTVSADLPGIGYMLNFFRWEPKETLVGTRGRAVDHVGFEVRNLKEFVGTLPAKKITLTTRSGMTKEITADYFPAYDEDGGLLVALIPKA